ncbi:MAG: creatininase family protein [Candidatus Heimdallarchaeota archaeon]|nr:creatininase family protein [Candidatus Heimdallarchaeota archaeon]
MVKGLKIENLTWLDIKKYLDTGYRTIVVAVGSIEQHGPHLPLKTDTIIGENLVTEITKKLGKALQGPTISFGCSNHHMCFPGTISLKPETLKAIISDYVFCMIQHGFQNIIFIPSHGGNFKVLEEIISKLDREYPTIKITGFTDLYKYIDITMQFSVEEGISKEVAGAHAGETETSLMMFLNNEFVMKDRFTPGYVGIFGKNEGEFILKNRINALTDKGTLGDPTKASATNGQKYLEKTANFLAEEIKKMLI